MVGVAPCWLSSHAHDPLPLYHRGAKQSRASVARGRSDVGKRQALDLHEDLSRLQDDPLQIPFFRLAFGDQGGPLRPAHPGHHDIRAAIRRRRKPPAGAGIPFGLELLDEVIGKKRMLPVQNIKFADKLAQRTPAPVPPPISPPPSPQPPPPAPPPP